MSRARPLTEKQDGSIRILTMDDGGMNVLSMALRTALYDALISAESDDSTSAVLLTARGPAFCAGGDLSEMDTGLADKHPNPAQIVFDLLPSLKVPVVAVVEALALGGGLELALACHHRLFSASVRIGLPEVTIGLLPGAGGTQLLPRAIGLEDATNMILSGRPQPVGRYADTALCNAILGDDPTGEALDYARVLTRADTPWLGTRRVEHPSAKAYLQSIRTNLAEFRQATPGHLRAVDCLEAAATLPIDKGRDVERTRFIEARAAEESPAYRYGFTARRAAARVPAAQAGERPRSIGQVAVIGAGVMGQGIALACAQAGLRTLLLDIDAQSLVSARDTLDAHFARAVKRGKMGTDKAKAALDQIAFAGSYDEIAQSDLVIEAVVERMDVKHAVFRELDRAMRPGAILASNTSTLDLNAIAASTGRPEDVLGLHFFNPAHVMPLMEIVRGHRTAPDVIATGFALAKRLRKDAVLSGVCDGFIGNRMIEQYLKQAQFLVEEGATPQEVDLALESWGMAMGPFRMMDLAGNDVNDAIRVRKRAERPDVILAEIPDILRDNGWSGQKTGCGWYDYAENPRRPKANAALHAAIGAWRDAKGISTRSIPGTEIIDRCILALVNEGAHILSEGIAQRGSDIDVVHLTGYGFPAAKGGPLYFADRVGLRSVVRRMGELGRNPHGDPRFWTPAPLISRLIDAGALISEHGTS